jgi:PadR family transcriptional regulator AphA
VQEHLAAGDWAVLAVVAEGPTHGFAVAKTLAPDGEIGRVWSLSRPLVYRALDRLVDVGLVEKGPAEPSERGPRRTTVVVTVTGKRLVGGWLKEPVEHVRDVRSLLMLKLLFIARSQRDPLPLLEAQRELMLPVAEALESRARSEDGYERTLALWRLESTRAVLRFLDATQTTAGRR